MAVISASRGSDELWTFHLLSHKAVRGATKPSVVSAKVTSGPNAATMMPPSAGPTLRTVLNPTLSRVIAAGRCRRSRMSPIEARQAGLLMAFQKRG